MGDMAAVFNDLRKAKQEQRAKRSEINMQTLHELGITAQEQSKNVFRIETEYGVVMYYPSSSCWQCKGKIVRGNVQRLRAWLLERDAFYRG